MIRGIGGRGDTPTSTDLEADAPHKTPVYFSPTDTTCNHSQASKESSKESSQSRTEENNDEDLDEKGNARRVDDHIEKHIGMTKVKRQPTSDLRLALTKSDGGPIYIEFGPDDPEDPVNWPTSESCFGKEQRRILHFHVHL